MATFRLPWWWFMGLRQPENRFCWARVCCRSKIRRSSSRWAARCMAMRSWARVRWLWRSSLASAGVVMAGWTAVGAARLRFCTRASQLITCKSRKPPMPFLMCGSSVWLGCLAWRCCISSSLLSIKGTISRCCWAVWMACCASAMLPQSGRASSKAVLVVRLSCASCRICFRLPDCGAGASLPSHSVWINWAMAACSRSVSSLGDRMAMSKSEWG